MRAWFRERQATPTVTSAEPLLPVDDVDAVVTVEEALEEDELGFAIGEARRFRAALADATSACLADLLADLSAQVLARELELAPADVQRIVEDALERYGADVVTVRVHPSEAALLGDAWRVELDERLRCGDVEIVVANGTIDARLGSRLARVLAVERG